MKEARGRLNGSATSTKRVTVIQAVDTSISKLDKETAMQCDQHVMPGWRRVRRGGVCRMIKGGHQISLKIQCSGPWH